MTASPLPIRNFSMEQDLQGLVRLLNETAIAERTGVITHIAELQAGMQLPGHDPNQDCFVAAFPDDPAHLAGYAAAWVAPGTRSANISLHVHPQWRSQGLSSALLERILARSSELDASQVEMIINSRRPGVADFLVAQGFTFQGAYTELRAPADQELPAPAWPPGFSVRSYAQLQDLALLTEAMNLCYSGLWGHQHATLEQMAEWLATWNEDGLFLIFGPGKELAGICRVEPNAGRSTANGQPTGYIDAPGFLPKYRRPELYRALLLTAMRWLQSQEQAIIELESWGDAPETLEMFGQFGFTVLRQFTAYQRPLKD